MEVKQKKSEENWWNNQIKHGIKCKERKEETNKERNN